MPANVVQVIGAGVIYDAAARSTAASWPLLVVAAAAAIALAALVVRGRRAVPTG